MTGGKWALWSFVALIALCFVLVGVSELHWKVDPSSGELGETVDYAFTLRSYDLHAGDTIYYEYESSVMCLFIITTDPVNPEVGEKLNLSGPRNSGSFECLTDGLYYLRVDFFETPATINYELYAFDQSSVLVMTVKPIVLTVSTVLLAFLLYRAFRDDRLTDPEKEQAKLERYWACFTSRVFHWVVIVAGAVMLTVASFIDYLNWTIDRPELVPVWPLQILQIGGMAVYFGLLLGLFNTWAMCRGQMSG